MLFPATVAANRVVWTAKRNMSELQTLETTHWRRKVWLHRTTVQSNLYLLQPNIPRKGEDKCAGVKQFISNLTLNTLDKSYAATLAVVAEVVIRAYVEVAMKNDPTYLVERSVRFNFHGYLSEGRTLE